MLHDPKTVIGSDFDQETGEKIAPQFIARLELANCMSPDKLVGVCNMVVGRVVIPFPIIVGRNTLGVDLKRRREHRKGAA